MSRKLWVVMRHAIISYDCKQDAESHFNKSERASIFGPGEDVSGYMNAASESLAPTMSYADYMDINPTSMQPKSVADPGGITGFIYRHQHDWLGKALYGAVKVFSSETVTDMANGANTEANLAGFL